MFIKKIIETFDFISISNQVQCYRLNQVQCALSNWPTFGNLASYTLHSSHSILHLPFFTLNHTPSILQSASFNFQPYSRVQSLTSNMTCRVCNDIDSYEDEDHLLVWKTLNSEEYDVRYSDVYQNVDKQYKVTQVFKKVLRRRNIYMETMDN